MCGSNRFQVFQRRTVDIRCNRVSQYGKSSFNRVIQKFWTQVLSSIPEYALMSAGACQINYWWEYLLRIARRDSSAYSDSHFYYKKKVSSLNSYICLRKSTMNERYQYSTFRVIVFSTCVSKIFQFPWHKQLPCF